MMTINAHIHWHDYLYFPYEKDFAQREVKALLDPFSIKEKDDGLFIQCQKADEKFRRLVYFSAYSFQDTRESTLQHELESSCSATGKQRRQSTRYSVHGIHEYKGKFNPQVVRGILNILNVGPGSQVFDPFCGSGTTLVECAYGNIKAVGCDVNPLAVFISNAKSLALSVPAEILKEYRDKIFQRLKSEKSFQPVITTHKGYDYLSKWFTPDVFNTLEHLKTVITDEAYCYKSIYLVIASDLIREYSLQEPADLRIRRRKTPLPDIPFLKVFQKKLDSFLENLEAAQKVTGLLNSNNHAYLHNSSALETVPGHWVHQPPYDAAITSPPYATALPYIDTQRLSLIWLDLIDQAELKTLEASLTGSREFAIGQRQELEKEFDENSRGGTSEIYKFCQSLKDALSEKDGFRRQAVPFLMYRYFCDMGQMFQKVYHTVHRRSPFALVIGHNRTTLGGQEFNIDTPNLLKIVASHNGWQHKESIPLQTYHRYSLHSKNAVNMETLLVFEKL